MSFVSEKLQRLAPYDPDTGLKGLHLDANESFLNLPEPLRAAISEKIAQTACNLSPDPLAQGVCRAFGERYGVDSRFITVGNGSDELISILLYAFVGKGERVLLTAPDFSMYRIYCDMAELQPVILGKSGDLTFNPDEMIALAKQSKVNLVLFSNPCNPTGLGIRAEEALRIADSLDCLVVVDEAYMDFWDQPVLREAAKRKNLIVLKTCSKVGLAAARLGFAVANAQLTDYLRAAKSPYNVNAMTQAAGEAFLKDETFLPQAVRKIRSSRDDLYSALKTLEAAMPELLRLFETHTNFVTAELKNASEVHRLLKESGISVRLMAGRYLRITTGNEAENACFLSAFEKILKAAKEGNKV